MRIRRFISKKDLVSCERKFEPWKLVGAGLAITGASLLLATYFLSGAMMKRKTSQDRNDVTDEISSIHYGQKPKSKNSIDIAQRILPMAKIYCSIQSCVVTCSLIPAASNPGIVAAVFVDSDYEIQCPENLLIEELIFDNCRFTNNVLSFGWFPTRLRLRKLTLRRCSLTVINADAFKTHQFQALSSLAIVENGISIFRKSLFDSLSNLEEIVIANNVIKEVEADLLAGTANTLQIIQIDNAIFSENALINITGKSQLPKVKLLSLTGNVINKIPAKVFQGVPNVESIYLTNSGIMSVEANAFDPISGSIRQLHLSNNKISFLPIDIFRSILKAYPNFKVTLANNDWNCNCDLEWLKNLSKTHLQLVPDEPLCTSPESNAALKFSEAEFCDVKFPAHTTKPIDPENEVTVLDKTLITLSCSAMNEGPSQLFHNREFRFRSRIPAFSVQEMENGSIRVSFMTNYSSHTLIWFSNDVNELNFNYGDIGCMTNVEKSFYLNDLSSGNLYTICMLNIFGELTSPFNCLSLKKNTNYDDSLWLTNEYKTMIISVLTAVFIFVSALSVVGSFYIVRKYPRLLKGSKRIIIVRHRAADAIVLPEGLSLESVNKDFAALPKSDDDSRVGKDYVTPMRKRKLSDRKISVISGTSSGCSSSANSYVSGIEPTTMQLMSWRIKRIKDNFMCHDSTECDGSDPPPLPPPRNKSIPSLSSDIDEREIPNDRNLISIFTHGQDA